MNFPQTFNPLVNPCTTPYNKPFPDQARKPMSMKDDFNAAVAALRNLSDRPDNATLLRLYALYKQCMEGDVRVERPSFPDLMGAAKWDAWHAVLGTGSDEAMLQYIRLVEDLRQAE